MKDIICEVFGAIFQTLFQGNTVDKDNAGEVVDSNGRDLKHPVPEINFKDTNIIDTLKYFDCVQQSQKGPFKT